MSPDSRDQSGQCVKMVEHCETLFLIIQQRVNLGPKGLQVVRPE